MMLIFALLAMMCFYAFNLLYWRRRKLPPGPIPLPILGNLLEIGRESPGTQALEKWRKKYGRIFTYWLGHTPYVALTDFELINEVLGKNSDACIDREFFHDFYYLIRGDINGIFHLNGLDWKEQSALVYKSFRIVGTDKPHFEEKLLRELEWLFEEVDKNSSSENLAQSIDVFVGSTINLWLFGYSFSGKKNEEFLQIKRCVVDFMFYSGLMIPTLTRCCPSFLLSLPYLREAVDQTRKRILTLHTYFYNQINGLRENSVDLHSNENTFSDASYVRLFLDEMHRHQEFAKTVQNKSGVKEFLSREGGTLNPNVLTGVLRDMWIAGQDTITNTIEWGIIFMIYNQDKQAKLHEELDRVVNSPTALIGSNFKRKLPYLHATINEIQRLGNIVPFNIPRKLTRPLNVDGFVLEKGTIINACISLLMYDENIFPEPNSFQPERFLNDDGSLRQIEEFLPFSMGRRMCIGREMAKLELYLFFANFMNRYKVEVSPEHGLPSLHRDFGISVKAKPFSCKLTQRT